MIASKPWWPVLLLEAAGFLIVASATWVNEIFDLPHVLFRSPPAVFNYHEALEESLVILALGAVVVFVSYRLLRRISQLEALLPICSFCKRIRRPETDPERQESWEQLEHYFHEKAGTQFSHGLCPECLEKHYGCAVTGGSRGGERQRGGRRASWRR